MIVGGHFGYINFINFDSFRKKIFVYLFTIKPLIKEHRNSMVTELYALILILDGYKTSWPGPDIP